MPSNSVKSVSVFYVRTRQNRFHFRREDQTRAIEEIVERLDTVAIACEHQPLGAAIPDRKREHAVQSLDAGFSPLGERLQQHLGVGARPELLAGGPKLGPQFLKVVDLAVVSDDIAPVGAHHRLMAGRGQVDDGQPSVAEPDHCVRVATLAIRPAMRNRIGHATDDDSRHCLAVEGDHSCNAAHTGVRLAATARAMKAPGALRRKRRRRR
jgi:hypothetical protein